MKTIFTGVLLLALAFLTLPEKTGDPQPFKTTFENLEGVDGYIHSISEERQDFMITFSQDGVVSKGVMCCLKSIEEARNTYPERNLVYLPEAYRNDFIKGEAPELTGVDGYIKQFSETDSRFRIIFATDGEASENGMCCVGNVQEARNSYPDKNLIYLPYHEPAQSSSEANSVPQLVGVDGYVYRMSNIDHRFKVNYAEDGILNWNGYCCPESLVEIMTNIDKNLVYLPLATDDELRRNIGNQEIPDLAGIDGYIHPVSDRDGHLKITFAENGRTSESGMCCVETLEEAKTAYPDKNLVYLPRGIIYN